MRVLILLFLFATLSVETAYGQSSPAGRGSNTSAWLPLSASAEKIQELRPEITEYILSQDAEAIQSSIPYIRQLYSRRRFTGSEADSAVLHGWKQLRLKVLEPTAPLSPETLVNYVSGFGMLTIKSVPGGAAVELDGDKLSDKTAAVAWPSAGTYRIKLSMDGYEPVEDTCKVEEGKRTVFERSLKPVKRKSEKRAKTSKPQ